MRRIFLSFLLAVGLFAQTVQAAPPLPIPRIIAVYFYADWCPNCKLLSPKYDAVRAAKNLDNADILFVKMDLTDKTRIRQSILLAQGLGFGDFLKAQGSATGYVAVLDAKSKKELTRFDNSATEEQIAAALVPKP